MFKMMRNWVSKQRRKKEWESPLFRFFISLVSTSLTGIISLAFIIIVLQRIDVRDFLVILIAWILIAILSAILDK